MTISGPNRGELSKGRLERFAKGITAENPIGGNWQVAIKRAASRLFICILRLPLSLGGVQSPESFRPRLGGESAGVGGVGRRAFRLRQIAIERFKASFTAAYQRD